MPTAEGWLYVAAIKDLFAGEIVGRSFGERMTTDLVTRALDQAVATRRPPRSLIHHSDRGSQYCSHEYQALLRSYEMRASMSRRGNCYDNGVSRQGLRVQRVRVPPGEESGPRSRVAVGRETELLKPTVERHFKVASKLPGLNASEPGGSFEMT